MAIAIQSRLALGCSPLVNIILELKKQKEVKV